MGFRFRLGPFTFGSSGARLSVWRGGTGVSLPLSGTGQTFGKMRIGPLSWYGRSGQSESHSDYSVIAQSVSPEEAVAVEAFGADKNFHERLRQTGMPWRGVQERLKEELPSHVTESDRVAYALVPKAMTAAFGQQGAAWITEKRPSKRSSGFTTWIVVR